MQDRFKFRFFDKKKQKMMYENSNFSDYCKDEWWGYEEQMALEALDVFDNPEHYILMQCTGLKDKNDKLIYEGDILNYSCLPGYLDIYTCTFNKGNFLIGGLLISNTHLKSEIIGNIYENPELLEVNNDH